MIEFIGKLHPLFVHLPIGFIILLGVLEWLAARPGGRDLAAANRIILALTIPISVASVVCGWLLANSGGYDAPTLFWHRWLGTGVAIATIALWILRQRGWLRAYRRSLFATLLLLTVASHFGGSLTHGSDFLSWPKTRSSVKNPTLPGSVLNEPIYATAIQPIFDKYCISCHGENKSKGDLRMDSIAHLIKGGESGSPIEAHGGNPLLLAKRLDLPPDDDEHMPPAGKPQLSANELKLLHWWLDSGAPTDKTVQELKPTPEMLQVIEAIAATPANKNPEVH